MADLRLARRPFGTTSNCRRRGETSTSPSINGRRCDDRAYAGPTRWKRGPAPRPVLERLVPPSRASGRPSSPGLFGRRGRGDCDVLRRALYLRRRARSYNVHDLAVLGAAPSPRHRRALLAAVEAGARARGRKGHASRSVSNARARQVYEAAGFAQALAGRRGRRSALLREDALSRPTAVAQSRGDAIDVR